MKNTIPSNAICYKKMPIWNGLRIPRALFKKHNTKVGVWGKINVIKGKLIYTVCDSNEKYILDPNNDGIILPQEYHFITIPDDIKPQDLEIQISFFRIEKASTEI